MSNEGLIVNSTAAQVKSEIVNQIRNLGRATPDALERAVFEAVVGREREEVDWSVEDNQAGYYTWVKSFDQLITELVEDGYVVSGAEGMLLPTPEEPESKI